MEEEGIFIALKDCLLKVSAHKSFIVSRNSSENNRNDNDLKMNKYIKTKNFVLKNKF